MDRPARLALLGRISIICLVGLIGLMETARAITGPTTPAGTGVGVIGYDASNNLAVGTSTTRAGVKLLVVGSSTAPGEFAIQVINAQTGPVLIVTNDGRVSIGSTSFASGTAAGGAFGPQPPSGGLFVHGPIQSDLDVKANGLAVGTTTPQGGGNALITGNLSVLGTITGASIPAGNVTAGVFGGVGSGALYAFPSNLGVATSSQVGLPQPLSVYGNAYISGNVGIGTTNPTLGELHISGNANSASAPNRPRIALEDLAGSGQWIIQPWVVAGDGNLQIIRNAGSGNLSIPSGNVGIGTTNPQTVLHLLSSACNQLRIERSGYGSYDLCPTLLMTGDTIDLMTSANTVGTGLAWRVNNGTFAFGVASSTNFGINTTAPKSQLDVNGNVAIGTYAGSTAAPANGLIVSGNVGIGTTGPLQPLQVGALTGVSDGELVLAKSNNGPNRAFKIGLDSNYYLSIGDYGYNGVNTYSPYMTISYANGYVGIATTTPGYPLTVAGTVYSSTGGFRFPDGTTQTTAAAASGQTTAAGNVTAGVFGGAGSGALYAFPSNLGVATGSQVGLPATLSVYGKAYISGANGVIDTSITADPAFTATGVLLKSLAATPYIVAKLGTTNDALSGFVVYDASNNERFRVQANGNVGIGITNPSGRLNLLNAGGSTTFNIGDTVTTGHTYTSLYTSADTLGYFAIQSVKTSGSTWGDIALNPSGGNVGIGTTGPVAKLNVNGGDLQVESGMGRFKGWYNAGSGPAAEIGYSGGAGYVMAYDRTAATYSTLYLQSNSSLITMSPSTNNIALSGSNANSQVKIQNSQSADTISFLNFTADNKMMGFDVDYVSGWIARNATVGAVYKSGGNLWFGGSGGNTVGGAAAINSYLSINLTTGNVGIATTTPGYPLTVAGTIYSSTGGFRFPDNTVQTTAAAASGQTTAAGNVTTGVFGGAGSGALYAFPSSLGVGTSSQVGLPSVLSVYDGGTSVVNTDITISGSLNAVNAGHSIDFRHNTANSYARVAGVTDSSGSYGELSFWTSSGLGGTAATEKVRITGLGNVGIGTASPSSPLVINTAVANMLLNSTTGTNCSYIAFTNTGGTGYIGDGGSLGSCLLGTQGLPYAMTIAAKGSTYPIQFGTNSTARMTIDSSGNVGIGTASPSTLLHLNANSGNVYLTIQNTSASQAALELATPSGAWIEYMPAGSSDLRLYNGADKVTFQAGGNVGIGTTGPSWPLSVQSAAVNLYTAGFVNTNTAASQSYGVYIQTGNTRTDAYALGVYSNAGANALFNVRNDGNVGIGTTAPAQLLTVGSAGNAANSFYKIGADTMAVNSSFYSYGYICTGNAVGSCNAANGVVLGPANTAAAVNIVNTGNSFFNQGNVGIGTSTPQALLSVGTTTSATVAIFGGGSGKITVGTVDPVYTIGGKQYATYLPGMTGQKEETTGNLQISCRPERSEGPLYNCTHTIDFKNLEEGSDLWLFAKVTNLRENFGAMTVLLTPSFDGRVWYEKDAANLRLIIHATPPVIPSAPSVIPSSARNLPGDSSASLQNDVRDSSASPQNDERDSSASPQNDVRDSSASPQNDVLEVSYRLTAPRFDAAQWSNYAEAGESGGFNLDSLK